MADVTTTDLGSGIAPTPPDAGPGLLKQAVVSNEEGSATFEVLRDRTLALLSELLSSCRERGAVEATARLTAAADRLRQGELTVLVCGEFKRGKSCLLNALLEEQPPLFPVDAAVTTSVITSVSWAETERIVAGYAGEHGVQEERVITRSEIAQHATEHGGGGRRAAVVSIGTPNPRLASGLVLVDTPGVGGIFAEHTTVTMGYLPRADAILFVSDFTQPLLDSELDFLSRAVRATRLAGDPDGLVFAVTKADLVAATERAEILANTTAKLARVPGLDPATLAIVPVSSVAKLDHLDGRDPQDLADSNFSALEERLWSTVNRRRARVLLSAALSDLETTAHAVQRPLDDEREALEEGTRRTLEEVRDETRRRNDELAELQRSEAAWRADLRGKLDALGTTLRTRARNELEMVWHRCDTQYLDNPSYLEDTGQLVEQLAGDAALIAGSLSELAATRAAVVLQQFSTRHGLHLQHPEIGVLPPPSVPPITVTGESEGEQRGGRAWEQMQHLTSGLEIGGTLGYMAVGIVGIAIPTLAFPVAAAIVGGTALAGGIASAVAARSRQAQADRDARRQAVRADLEVLRKAQAQDLDDSLNTLVGALVDAVSAELDSRIEQERESVADALDRLAEVQRATRDESDQRREALDAQREPLQRIRRQVTLIAEQAGGLGSRAAALQTVARGGSG